MCIKSGTVLPPRAGRKPFRLVLAAGLLAVLAQRLLLATAQAPDGAPADDPLRAAAAPGLPAFSGPRELLRDLGIQESHYRALEDGRPLHPDEQETLWRLLFAVNRFDHVEIFRWTRAAGELANLLQRPAEFRGEMFFLRGQVVEVVREQPLPEAGQRFEMDHYFRCKLLLAETNQEALVYARTVPRAWKLGLPIQERASVSALFAKLSGPADSPLPVFVAKHVAWHPAGHLGDLGVDLSLYDTVAPKGRLLDKDRECFYQLLHAMGQRTIQEWLHDARGALPRHYDTARRSIPDLDKFISTERQFHIVPLIKSPEDYQGALLLFEGIARRITQVRVEDPDIVERYGLTTYWEMEVYLDLGNYQLTLDGKKFTSFPVVCCVRELPPGMPVEEFMGERVIVPGVFLKLWEYQSQLSAQKDPRALQSAPLLIARGPIWLPPPQPEPLWSLLVGGALVVSAILILAIALWRFRRRPRLRTADLASDANVQASLKELERHAPREP